MERLERATYRINYIVVVPAFVLSLCMLVPCFYIINGYPTTNDYWHAGILFLIVGYLIFSMLPLTIKLIKGIPAIEMNTDQLIIHTKNIAYDWADIENVDVVNGSKYLVIKLKDSSTAIQNTNEIKVLLTVVLCDGDDLLETLNTFLKQQHLPA